MPVYKITIFQVGVVAHAFNASTGEAEAVQLPVSRNHVITHSVPAQPEPPGKTLSQSNTRNNVYRIWKLHPHPATSLYHWEDLLSQEVFTDILKLNPATSFLFCLVSCYVAQASLELTK